MAQVAFSVIAQLSLSEKNTNLARLREGSLKLLTWKRATGTLRIYDRDFRIYSAWCEANGIAPIPASSETLRLFLFGELDKGFKVATVERRMAGIRYYHDLRGQEFPQTRQCREMLACARRERREQQEGKTALDPQQLVRICKELTKLGTNAGTRDRAILVFGFASALRRSEISRLDLADIKITSKGIAVYVSWSKNDQSGEGREFGIFPGEREVTDPVRTMRAWIDIRGKEPGPLFTQMQRGRGRNGSIHGCDDLTMKRLSGKTVADIVHRSVAMIGLDPDDYAAHSLRSGLVTAAADNGASDREIMRASGHRSVKVMQKYIRPVRIFANRNVLEGVL